MISVPLRRTNRGRQIALAAILVTAACAGTVGKPPPPADPDFTRVVVVAGAPIVNAAKSARALQNDGFSTRRFRSDSTWGSRVADNMSVRLRYTSPSRDSTRILVELWGKCERGGRGCFLGELVRLVAALTTEEAPPQ